MAQMGLPGSPNSGYELFDNMGALGLTSFMQEVTKTRALEGELARTIQYIRGVRAARIHLVLPETGPLRNKKRPPSASVVISADGNIDPSVTSAIRHVVAAAIPEMSAEQVSVIGADGKLLAGGGGAENESVTTLIELERQVSEQLQMNIRRTLTPYFGFGNFEVSTLARLNIDKKQASETAFDPEKRVERSVRVVKEAEKSQALTGNSSVSVEQNIPNEASGSGGSEKNNRAQDRKEETTNYEISSKTATTISDGYRIENISVAVVVNRKRMAEMLGKDPSEDEVKAQLAQIEKLVTSAAGLDIKRGDNVAVTAVNFAADALAGDGGAGDIIPMLFSIAATLIKSLTVLGVAALIVWAGLRPLARSMLANATALQTAMPSIAGPPVPGLAPPSSAAPLDMPHMASPLLESVNPFGEAPSLQSGWDPLNATMSKGPVEQLGHLLDRDQEHAAAVLRNWVKTG